MRIIFFATLLLAMVAHGAVYEARNSDDIDFFMEHNPEENGAILFYDPDQEQTDDTANANTETVLSIFKNIGEEGRSDEDWVNQLNDKVHLMKVDKTSLDNARAVEDYKVGKTPLIVLLDAGKVVLEELVDDETFDHIKEVYVAEIDEKTAEEKAKADADAAAAADAEKPDDDGGWSSTDLAPEDDKNNNGKDDALEAIEAANEAKTAADEAKKAANDATAAMKELQKSFDAQKDKKTVADAKKKAEQAQKELEKLKKQIADHLADDAKEKAAAKNATDSAAAKDGNNTQQNGGNNNQQQNGGNQQQNGGNQQQNGNQQIQYIPVVRAYQPFNSQPIYQQPTYQQPQQQQQQPQQQQSTSGQTKRIISTRRVDNQ